MKDELYEGLGCVLQAIAFAIAIWALATFTNLLDKL